MARFIADRVTRFWLRVERRGEDECWPFKGARESNGYGYPSWEPYKHELAHRVAYELCKGPIPEGMLVQHSCDNPPCCNPKHLSVGTKKTNSADMYAKGRDRSRGERNKHAVLTEALVLQIISEFKFYTPRRTNAGELAEKYGVGWSTVYNAATGRTWRHLHPPENRKPPR